MKCCDFEYDGIRLSDKGFIICKFDSGGVDTISNGSTITFNTVPTLNGNKHEFTSAQYDDCITATFQICKNICSSIDNEEISLEDIRDIMRWLNRKGFYKFKLLDNEYSGFYFEASFNVSKIEFNGKTYGFELEMKTNRPFAIGEPVIISIDNKSSEDNHTIFSRSDEEGYIYPDMRIVIGEDVDENSELTIYNDIEDRTMTIKNCQPGEVISINYPMISTNKNRKIQNDFNWIFFRIASAFKNRQNNITISLPCSIKIKYTPIIKISV